MIAWPDAMTVLLLLFLTVMFKTCLKRLLLVWLVVP